MKLPFVSRERLEYITAIHAERVAQYERQLAAAALRETELLNIIRAATKTSSTPVETATPEPAFVLPDEVVEAIRQRAPRGSRLEALLKEQARKMLGVGDSDPEQVAGVILMGDRSLDDEPW